MDGGLDPLLLRRGKTAQRIQQLLFFSIRKAQRLPLAVIFKTAKHKRVSTLRRLRAMLGHRANTPPLTLVTALYRANGPWPSLPYSPGLWPPKIAGNKADPSPRWTPPEKQNAQPLGRIGRFGR